MQIRANSKNEEKQSRKPEKRTDRSESCLPMISQSREEWNRFKLRSASRAAGEKEAFGVLFSFDVTAFVADALGTTKLNASQNENKCVRSVQ